MLQAIIYIRGDLTILDQLKLPLEVIYEKVKNVKDGWRVIKEMKVRGAPAIALVGALSLAVELYHADSFECTIQLAQYVVKQFEYLITARPTAVNIKQASDRFSKLVHNYVEEKRNWQELREAVLAEAEDMIQEDIDTNKSLSAHGANHIVTTCRPEPTSGKFVVLTHCNTGTLATALYGTALGVVRRLNELQRLERVFFTETRPYNQGSRLTAFELQYENIPSTMICDNMVAALMNSKHVSAVVVGADRVTANGDTANKIGTYQIALLAKQFQIPFYVACPLTTLDLSQETGDTIVIEERPATEMIKIKDVQTAPSNTHCWNPSFDVTPNELITGGVITERGVFHPSQLNTLA